VDIYHGGVCFSLCFPCLLWPWILQVLSGRHSGWAQRLCIRLPRAYAASRIACGLNRAQAGWEANVSVKRNTV